MTETTTYQIDFSFTFHNIRKRISDSETYADMSN